MNESSCDRRKVEGATQKQRMSNCRQKVSARYSWCAARKMEDLRNLTIRSLVNEIQEELLGNVIKEPTNVKRNSKNFAKNGEMSFPLNLLAWRDSIGNQKEVETCSNILEYYLRRRKFSTIGLSSQDITEKATELLINASSSWSLNIVRCSLQNDRICLFVNRTKILEFSIKNAVRRGKDYGRKESEEKSICLRINNDAQSDLTTRRLNLIKETSEQILTFKGFKLVESQADFQFILTTKSQGQYEQSFLPCVCGVVKNRDTNAKEVCLSWSEYLDSKIGEVTTFSELKCPELIKNDNARHIALADVTFELLSVKPSRPVFVKTTEDPDCKISNSKGGSFVLYNAARINAIFQKFKQEECLGSYPGLPDIDKVDFTLLSQEDEWDLVYNYIFVFPEMIEDAVCNKETLETAPHTICLFLSHLCQKFSIYYRRTRILTEGRDHLVPMMMTRLYLLRALQIVIHNSLAILNIVPVSQM